MAAADLPETIAITECKAHLLRLADDVARTGRSILVTRHGKPLVRITPAEEPKPASLKGTARQLVSDEEFIAPFPERWDSDPWWMADA